MVYVFDLDGVICTHEKDYAKAYPYRKVISKINALARNGHTIIIDTARGTETGIEWKHITEEQLKEWGVQYDFLRCGVKFAADWYIDDRGVNITDFMEDE